MVRVSGKHADRDSRTDLAIAGDQLHLAGLDQWIVVVADIADAIAFVLLLRVFPLAALYVVLRPRKGRDRASIFVVRVPAAVIEMKMRIDDDIDFVGRDLR